MSPSTGVSATKDGQGGDRGDSLSVCRQTLSLANNVYAATISFAFAFSFQYLFGPFNELLGRGEISTPVLWQRALLVLFSISIILDDWYASRRIISKAGPGAVDSLLIAPRFLADVAIAILAFPLIMTAALGSHAFGGILGAIIFIGGVWLSFYYREAAELDEKDRFAYEARTALHFISGFLVLMILILFLYRFSATSWTSKYTVTGGWVMTGALPIFWLVNRHLVATLWIYLRKLGSRLRSRQVVER